MHAPLEPLAAVIDPDSRPKARALEAAHLRLHDPTHAPADHEPGAAPGKVRARRFDVALGCWIAAPREAFAAPRAPRASQRPFADGSGRVWCAYDRTSGVLLWRIEAREARDAEREAARLARAHGGAPKEIYLRAA